MARQEILTLSTTCQRPQRKQDLDLQDDGRILRLFARTGQKCLFYAMTPKGGRKFALTKAQVRMAQAAMASRDTSVSELCKELRGNTGHAPPVCRSQWQFTRSRVWKSMQRSPTMMGIGDQVDPPSFVVETPFHQATTERPAGLICGEKIGLARRRLPPTAVPSRSGSEMSAECGTPLYAD